MNRYSFRVAWSDEDGEYVATCIEFPDLSGLGATPGEALREIEGAVSTAVEVYDDEGWRLPEARTLADFSGQFRLRLPKSVHRRLTEEAEFEGVSLNALVNTFVAEGLGRQTRFADMNAITDVLISTCPTRVDYTALGTWHDGEFREGTFHVRNKLATGREAMPRLAMFSNVRPPHPRN